MIIRREHKRNFTTIANEAVEDGRLSYEALGLLTYLISRPDNWEVRIEQLRARTKIGRDKLYRVVKELQESGYLKHERVYENGKVAFGRWIVMEDPTTKREQISTSDHLHPSIQDEASDLHPENLESRKAGRITKTDTQQKVREGAYASRGPLQFKPVVDKRRDDAFEPFLRPVAEGGYPPEAIDNIDRARSAWQEIDEGEWKLAIDALPRFLMARKRIRRSTVPSLETYIRDKKWQGFPEPTGADAPVPTIELKPYSRELWLLFWNAVAEAIKGGEERHFNRLRDRLGQLTRGLVTPTAAVSAGEELIAMAPVVVGSAEHDLWSIYGERLGLTLPRPDIAGVIFVPAKEPPTLRLGWKQYRLARPTSCTYRDRVWWWRLFQIDDGDIIETQLREGAGHAGACPVYFGPWPVSADLVAMVEIRQGSEQWGAWERWFDSKGIWLRWPDPSIWCPSEYPPVFGETAKERASA